jgi:hypothetical protein
MILRYGAERSHGTEHRSLFAPQFDVEGLVLPTVAAIGLPHTIDVCRCIGPHADLFGPSKLVHYPICTNTIRRWLSGPVVQLPLTVYPPGLRQDAAEAPVRRNVVLVIDRATAENLIVKLPERLWVIILQDLVDCGDQLLVGHR